MEKLEIVVFQSLCKHNLTNEYKLITFDDLKNDIKEEITEKQVSKIMESLEEKSLISIKFNDEKTYCYSVIEKTRKEFENIDIKSLYKKKKSKTVVVLPKRWLILIAGSSFLGSLIAQILFLFL